MLLGNATPFDKMIDAIVPEKHPKEEFVKKVVTYPAKNKDGNDFWYTLSTEKSGKEVDKLDNSEK